MDDEEKERNRVSMCSGKYIHETFSAAMKQAKVGRRATKGYYADRKIQAYKCDFCFGYHVGHKNPGRKKNGIRRNRDC